MNNVRAAFCLLACIAVSCAVAAQEVPTLRQKQRDATQYLRKIDDGSADSPIAGLTSKIMIEGSEDEGTAKLRVGSVFGSSEANVWRWSLGASAPFDKKKEDEHELGTLSGLTAGSTASFELGWINTDSLGTRAAQAGMTPNQVTQKRLSQACDPYAKEVFGVELAKLHEKLGRTDRIPCSNALFSPELFAQSPIVLELKVKAESDDVARKQLLDLQSAWQRYFKEFWSVLPEPGPLLAAGVRAEAGNAKYEYFVDTDFATKLDKSKTSTAVTLYLNRVYKRQLFGIGFTRKRDYEAGRKTSICSPIGTTGTLDCSEKVIGAPKGSTSKIVFAEWRHLISDSFAISPIVEYDVDDHEWAVRAPLYAAVNKDGDLVGGLSVNWDSKDDKAGVVVFFGKKFSLFE